MNKNLNLIEILKDCPTGTKFYTPVWGEVSFEKIVDGEVYTIEINTGSGYNHYYLTKEGCYIKSDDAECIIFPSKEQRDWSKFTAPWYKKKKFDPKTLQHFDKVICQDDDNDIWECNFFSNYNEEKIYPYGTISYYCKRCIPYNDDTKHLVGTSNEAPEYYRYWDD